MKIKKAAVIGMGKTGFATAAFLSKRGIPVAVTDEKPPSQWGENLALLNDLPTKVAIEPYDDRILAGVDLVVPSPGVYPANPILLKALQRGIEISSELELAFHFLKTPMVAITGTNGKTTTTTLIGEILRKTGKKVFVGGNIGDPLIGYTDGPQEADWVVIEISSFQLMWVKTLHPRIAILLNVTPDHIDYHGSLDSYREVKERMFARQTPDDLAILNGDEKESRLLAEKLSARTAFFSSTGVVDSGMFKESNNLVHTLPDGKREWYPEEMIHLPGRHNLENVMAAVMAARGCGCPAHGIISAVAAFRGLPHRIEYVGEKNGVRFYDDSKGTNVGAVLRAIESFSEPLILLIGGRDKEGDFETLIPSIKRRVKETVVFGEAREKINSLIGKEIETTLCRTMREALQTAYRKASAGDVVLLSPGCSSFDEFKNYKDRGDRFQEWVKQL